MRPRALATALILAAVPLAAAPACDPGTAVVLPILIISNTWEVEGQPNRFFSFASADDGKPAGVITGEESQGDQVAPLDGEWQNGRIEFTVRWHTPVRYTAPITDSLPVRMVITSDRETLVLLRDLQ